MASISSSTAEPIVRRLSTLEGSGFELSVPRPTATVSRLCRDGAASARGARRCHRAFARSRQRDRFAVLKFDESPLTAERGGGTRAAPCRGRTHLLFERLRSRCPQRRKRSAPWRPQAALWQERRKPAEASTTMPASGLLAPVSGSPCGGSILITSAPPWPSAGLRIAPDKPGQTRLRYDFDRPSRMESHSSLRG